MGQAIVPLAELTQGSLLHTLVLDLQPRVKERATGCIEVLYKYETAESMKQNKSRSQAKSEIDQLMKRAMELGAQPGLERLGPVSRCETPNRLTGAFLAENRDFLVRAKFFVEQAADKFVQCTQTGKLETAEQVAQFLHSQGLIRYIVRPFPCSFF